MRGIRLREPVRCVAQRRAKVVSERVGGGEAALAENADQPVGRGLSSKAVCGCSRMSRASSVSVSRRRSTAAAIVSTSMPFRVYTDKTDSDAGATAGSSREAVQTVIRASVGR